MSDLSRDILTEHQTAQMERLIVLREYQQNISDPYVKSALGFTIEDTQEAIARVSSRLRHLGAVRVSQISGEVTEKLLRQSRSRRNVGDQIKFIYQGLTHQLQWYENQVKVLQGDADTQAILVALAEQLRVRIERWKNLMDEMKVSW
ncbi:MAG TPA: hypothetical protein PKE64_09165 [Anaerolineae bacterium]|nr:hypothetical protein [Anaerolineae bacterium]HMR64165.1 hypothetical protein [Anaerolineae bacterium]